MAICESCGNIFGGTQAHFAGAKCADCLYKREVKQPTSKQITLTTESHVPDVVRLGIVASEVVLGMNLFKDVLANLRDIFGGRSGTVQKTLSQAREAAFDELRLKASELGADAVIAIDIDYHSLSTNAASTNMLIVAVSGTAVRMGAPSNS